MIFGPSGGMLILSADMFNLFVQCVTLLSQLKTYTIMPIHKNGTRLDPENHRRINPTPVTFRTLERFTERQPMTYLVDKKLANSGQHDFLQEKSCATCATDCLNAATAVPNGGKLVTRLKHFPVALISPVRRFHS